MASDSQLPDARSLGSSLGTIALVIVLVTGAVAGTVALHHEVRDRFVAVEDVSGDSSITVTYATGPIGTETFTVHDVAPSLADPAADWAYLPRSSVPSVLKRVADRPGSGAVAVGPWVLVGDLQTATERIGATTLHVVAPVGMDLDPARKASFLDLFLSPYTFNADSGEQVTLVAAPSTLPSSGRTYGTTAYVATDAFWDGIAGSVWIHEYVHAREDVELGPGMAWFDEASATYLSYRVMEEQYDGVTDADVRNRLASSDAYPETSLADRSSWNGTEANYDRGARLLYAVDAEIRSGSDHEHTLVDVFREMNRREEPITVEEFVDIVETFSGEEQPRVADAIRNTGGMDHRINASADVFADGPRGQDAG